MNLPIFGKVSFDNSTKSQFMQVLYKDDFNLDNNELQIELSQATRTWRSGPRRALR